MSTPYADLYPLIRAAVGDRGVRDPNGDLKPNTFDYANDDIAPVITLALLEIPKFSGDGTDITPTISTDDEKGLIAFLSALYLALPDYALYSLEVPNLRYVKGANELLIANLYGKYKMYLESGGDLTTIFGTYDLLFNAGQLVFNRVQEVVNQV